MSETIITKYKLDVDDLVVEAGKASGAVKAVGDDTAKSGKEASKSLNEVTKSLQDNQKASRELGKTIAQQEKLVAEWRKELLQVEQAQKTVAKGKREYFQLAKANKELNRAIKENVADIKSLKIDKRIVDGNIKDLKTQEKAILSNTKSATSFKDRIEAAFSAIGINISPITRRFDDVSKAIGGAADSSGKLATGQDAVTASTTKGSKALKLFRVALAATGIGAIVVAIGTLVTAFFSTQRGADALNRVLMPLKATFQALWGLIQDLSTDIVDAFKDPQQALKDLGQLILDNIINRFLAFPKVISSAVDIILGGLGIIGGKIKEFVADTPLLNNLFDVDIDQAQKDSAAALQRFKDGIGGAASAVIQLGIGIDEEQQRKTLKFFKDAADQGIEAGARLEEIGRRIDEVNIRIARNQGRLNREFEEAREIANDYNRTEEERFAAIEKARKAQEELANLEKSRVQLELERVRIQKSLSDTSRKDLEEEAKLIGELEQIDADRIKKLLDLERQSNAITKQRLDREQALADEIEAIRDRLTGSELTEFDKRRKENNKYYDDLEERAQGNAEQLVEIRKLRALDEAQIDIEQAQLKLLQEQELIDAIQQLRNTDIENQIQSEKDRFERLFELAKGDVDRTIELQELLAQRIVDINKKAEEQIVADKQISAQAQIAALQSIANTSTAFLREMVADTQDLVLFEIGMNLAAGLASAVASGAGVAFPANLAAIASGVAAVLGGIAQAKSALQSPPSFKGGGATSNTSRSGGVDGHGGFNAILHPREYVIDSLDPERGLRDLFADKKMAGIVSRWSFKQRVDNATSGHTTINNTKSTNWSDSRMVRAINNTADLQALTVQELRKLSRSNKFKRAGAG